MLLVVVLMLMLLMVVVLVVASSWWLGAPFFGSWWFQVWFGLVVSSFASFLFLLLMLVLIWTGPLLVLFSNTLLPLIHTTTQTKTIINNNTGRACQHSTPR